MINKKLILEPITSNIIDVTYYSGHTGREGFLHYHNYNEIILITKGAFSYMMNNVMYQSEGNCIVFFKENKLHTTNFSKSILHERYLVRFKLSFISEVRLFNRS